MVKNADLDQYSAVIACGGDGTIHEVVNGLLHRDDGKKIPLGLLPNGSGNDMCRAIELKTMEQGLNYLIKGDLIKSDVFEALLDHENVEEVKAKARQNPSFNAMSNLRYCVINTSLLLVGLTAKNAVPMKPYIGKTAYTVSCINELCKMVLGDYDLEFDDGKHKLENI